jgi:hypothetical protein
MRGIVENPSDDPLEEKCYDVKTILGTSERESFEVYCRTMLELLNTEPFIFKMLKESGFEIPKGFKNPFANKPILMSISLPKYSSEEVEKKVFKGIIDAFKNNIVKVL